MTRIRPWVLLAAGLAATQVAWKPYLTHVDWGPPVRWSVQDVPVVVDQHGTASVPGDDEFGAVDRSMDTWSAVSCPHPTLRDAGRVDGVSPGKGTGKNLIIWEDEAHWEFSTTDKVIAWTTLHFDPDSGAADKFDLELNDFQFKYTVSDDPAHTQTDVQNTVTHELGHGLGLDHSDDPLATMFKKASSGELSKRTLAEDDIEGLCSIYWVAPPAESGPEVFEADVTWPEWARGDLATQGGGPGGEGGGCAAGRQPALGPGAWQALALVVALVAGARRRRAS